MHAADPTPQSWGGRGWHPTDLSTTSRRCHPVRHDVAHDAPQNRPDYSDAAPAPGDHRLPPARAPEPPDLPSACTHTPSYASAGTPLRSSPTRQVNDRCRRPTDVKMQEAPRSCVGPLGKNVRLRPTLPHRHQCSTIGAEGLSFRVRNGAGRFPFAMTAETLWRYQSVPDRTSGTTQWTRSFFVVKSSAY